jgi:hypothetical protein
MNDDRMQARWVAPLAVVLASAASLVSACGGDGDGSAVPEAPAATPPPPVVSSLSYRPNPFSNDLAKMHIRFTTTGPAGPHREYVVHLSTGRDDRDQHCYADYESDPVRPGAAGTYEVTIDKDAYFDDDLARFCFGKALLTVVTQNFESPLGRRALRKLSLQILPSSRR